MADHLIPSQLGERFDAFPAKDRPPASLSVLNRWVSLPERRFGTTAGGGRLGWLVASSVAVAVVQRALDHQGRSLFLLKGGALLQHRLTTTDRATKDIDGLVRGDLDEFFAALDDAFRTP